MASKAVFVGWVRRMRINVIYSEHISVSFVARRGIVNVVREHRAVCAAGKLFGMQKSMLNSTPLNTSRKIVGTWTTALGGIALLGALMNVSVAYAATKPSATGDIRLAKSTTSSKKNAKPKEISRGKTLSSPVIAVATFADLASTPAGSGEIANIAGHTAPGIGGGAFIDCAGTITNDGGTLINNIATPGRHWKRIYQGTKYSDWYGCGEAANTTVALNAFLALGGDLTISPRSAPYMIDPVLNPTTDTFGGLQLVSNTSLTIPFGCTLQAIGVSQTFSSVVQAYNVSNIKIRGFGSIKGERLTHIGTTGEHGMGIIVRACDNVDIDEVEIADCWGDGIYHGYANIGGVHKNSRHFRVGGRVRIRDCRRQGISNTGTNYFSYEPGLTIYNIKGTAPAAAIDLEPDSQTYPNTDGVINGVIGYNCTQGLAMYAANKNISGSGNYFSADMAALNINDIAENINVGGLFIGGLNGVQPAVNLDGTGFIDMSSVHFTSNMTIVGHGSEGALRINETVNYADIRGVHIKVPTAQVTAIVNTGNNYFFDNVIETTGNALSGTNKTVVYSTKGVFGNNKFINTTNQTPVYQIIGTTQQVQPYIKLP